MRTAIRTVASERLRPTVRPGLFGVGLGFVGPVLLVAVVGDVHRATVVAFSLATGTFGFALLGWSAAVVAGPGFASLQHHLSGRSTWNEGDARRVLSRVVAFGFGGMVGASALQVVLGLL